MNSDNLFAKVAAQLALPAGSHLLIGLSGGVDSVVLLHLLHRLAPQRGWQLSALHVHHGISPNADAWAAFCVRLCAALAIPLQVERVNIAPLRAHGLEAAARKLRHAAFADQHCDFVVLAHHLDDQVETLLLQLLRGAGVRGAAAMPVLGTGATKIVRPLLHSSRQDILEYAAFHQLEWIEDESNLDDDYPRNFLRHQLLPLLGEKFPAYRATLARSTQNFAEASALLDDLARIDATEPLPHPVAKREDIHALAVSRLQALSLPRAKNLLRYFLYQLGAPMPQAVRLDDMLHQLCAARPDASVCITFGGWQVRRYQDRVYAAPELCEFDSQQRLTWQGEAELAWPALHTRILFNTFKGQGISLAKLQGEPVTLRLRSGGETLRPSVHSATRTLKNLLQEHHILPWQRDRWPLLYCGEQLVAVPGVAIAAGYQTVGEPGLMLRINSYL